LPQRYIFATTLQKLCLANDSFSIGTAHTRKAASELRRDELLPVLNVALNLTTKPVHCTYTHTKFTWHLQGTAVCVGLKKNTLHSRSAVKVIVIMTWGFITFSQVFTRSLSRAQLLTATLSERLLDMEMDFMDFNKICAYRYISPESFAKNTEKDASRTFVGSC